MRKLSRLVMEVGHSFLYRIYRPDEGGDGELIFHPWAKFVRGPE